MHNITKLISKNKMYLNKIISTVLKNLYNWRARSSWNECLHTYVFARY